MLSSPEWAVLTILLAVAVTMTSRRARAFIASVVTETYVYRVTRSAVRPVRAVAADQRGLFGISDQVFGILIGITLMLGAIFSVNVAQAWSKTGACSAIEEKIDSGMSLKVAANQGNGVLNGGAGTSVTVDDAQLAPYIPGGANLQDPAAAAGTKYTVFDTSSGTNGDSTWKIVCPGNHMGLTTLRWASAGCSLAKHTLVWVSETGPTCQ